MVGFDRKRLLSNITVLTKEGNVKIGELEAAAGVSPGYFSRLNKGESNAIPNIEVIAAVAEKLSVTIDSLVKVDFAALTPSERYLIDFINRLIEKTTTYDLLWEEETVKKMLAAGVDNEGYAKHPLFEVRLFDTDSTNINGYPEYEERPVYNSLFHEGEAIGLLGSAYWICIDGKSTFWIVEVGDDIFDDCPPPPEIEFYMEKKGQITPICHTSATNAASPFNGILFSLYNAAAESSKHPKINPDVKSTIDLFMENVDLPF